MSETKPNTMFKVLRLEVLKPAGDTTWKELGEILKTTRYRVYRLANLAVSEAYLGFHLFRTGQADSFRTETIGNLSRRLREMLLDEGVSKDDLDSSSVTGALPDTVVSALYQYKIRAVTALSKWREVVRGKSSLPTFRANMAIPIRCDKPQQRRLEKTEKGDVELELMVRRRPYPRIVLKTGKLNAGQRSILERLLENKESSKKGYRQRYFEIKQDWQTGQWWLNIAYEFPIAEKQGLDPNVVVGVDLGVSVPLYAAINNGHARLGRRHFQALGNRIRSLQNQVMARRRAIQKGGRVNLAHGTARSGHGVKRKLRATEKLQARIDHAYTTLNHQLSAAVIDFAENHGAKAIQIEDLSGLKEHLTGTYLGMRWRYHQLQQFLEYKAQEKGMTLTKVNPRYTSRRCSQCGFIHKDFDRAYRDTHRADGKVVKFVCPECEYESDPDYNAARNIGTLDIESKISVQCKAQGLD